MSGAPTAPAEKPSRAGGLLSLVRKLVSYGTFLAATLRQRGLGNHPAVHGRQFGTTNVALILARIARGLLRAAALETRLQRSAARLDAPPPPRAPRARTLSAATEAAPAPRRRASPGDTDDETLLAHLPTPEQIAIEIRRRPIGEVIADICRDFGIMPAHPLWRDLAPAILCESGRYAALIIDILNRRHRVPIPDDWPDEPPPEVWAAWSYAPAPAATGPP